MSTIYGSTHNQHVHLIKVTFTALCTGIEIPVRIAFGIISICLSIATAITRKTNQIYDANIRKHDKIGVLDLTKLDSIHNIVSKAVEYITRRTSANCPREAEVFVIETRNKT